MPQRASKSEKRAKPIYKLKLPDARAPDDEPQKQRLRADAEHKARRRRIFLVVLVVVAALGGISWGVLNYREAHSPQNKRIRSVQNAVDFPLYYPGSLPRGYSLDHDSFSSSGDKVTFIINAPTDKQWFVSEQRRPKDLDLEFFHSKQLQNTRQLDTPVGRAFIGSSKGRGGLLTISLVAEPTWVLITSPDNVSQPQLNQILTSLRTVKD